MIFIQYFTIDKKSFKIIIMIPYIILSIYFSLNYFLLRKIIGNYLMKKLSQIILIN